MTAFTHFFRPLAFRSGVQLCSTSLAIGTGGLGLTATATVSGNVPLPTVGSECKLLRLSIVGITAAAGGSTITAQAFKRHAGADTSLSAAFDLTTGGITTTDLTLNLPLTSTLTDANKIFAKGDALRIDLAAATTVTTAPQATITAEWAVLS